MKGLSGIRDRFLSAGRQDEAAGLEDLEFVVLDTETTGMDPVVDRILSIGALRLTGGRIRVREALEIFVSQEHFDQRSVPIHGILRAGPNPRIPEKEALIKLQQYVGEAILVGHHIQFDLEMIRQARRRHGLPPLTSPSLDTGVLYKKTLLKSPLLGKKEHYSLDELAEKFDLPCKDRHTALGDAYITAMAFLKILSRLEAKEKLTPKKLLRMGR